MVISSRRLAREWALKILYQMDVNRTAAPDTLDTSLERLRREFVQRGSRTASGSLAEEISLELLTQALADTLPGLRPPFERALQNAAGRLFAEAPVWQEQTLLNVFKAQPPAAIRESLTRVRLGRQEKELRGLALQVRAVPVRTLPPVPPEREALTTGMSPEETERLSRFATGARRDLPHALETLLWERGLAFLHECAAESPSGIAEDARAWLENRQTVFLREQADYWRKVSGMVEKQIGEWMRTAAFTYRLVSGAQTQQKEIDAAVAALSSGWRVDRQAAVDRNILRLAAFELLFLPNVPTAASINEAVELAKKYSTEESGRFVNGVLGALAGRVGDKVTAPISDADALAVTDGDSDDAIDLPDADLEEEDAPVSLPFPGGEGVGG